MTEQTKAEQQGEFRRLLEHLEQWEIPEGAVDTVHDAAKASLQEVKALTEYEDGKVSRLLTVVAFLSAVVGAVFTRFATNYTWPPLSSYASACAWWLPALTYLAFFAYAVLVASAVYKLLTGIRPTFNAPASWNGGNAKDGLPPSMLFYKGILDVSPRRWAETFSAKAGKDGKDLKRLYAKCYITEAYLVAEKVAKKLSIVDPGVQMLRVAQGILVVFFILFAATLYFVTPALPV